MTLYAVTVLGRDRPGIVAEVTGALAELGGNLEDSTMTLLRGHFAMVLLVRAPGSQAELAQRLGPLGQGGGLSIDVRPVPDTDPQALSATHVLSVHGADRPGIVSELTQICAEFSGSITDLSTRLAGGLYILIAELALAPGMDSARLCGDLTQAADRLGVDITLRELAPDDL